MRGLIGLLLLRWLLAADSVPPVYLNHIYIRVPSETIEAITASEFLRETFSGFDVTTTKRGDGSTYTGAYVHGKRTAIEILPIDAKSGRLGIALSVDDVNELAAMARRIADKTGLHPQIKHMTRNVAGRVVPWFDYIVLNPPAPDRLLVTWSMAHDPRYHGERYPDLKPEENGTTREQYQARKYRPDKLFADITAVSFVVPADVIQTTMTDLAAFGWVVRKHRKQHVALGPETKLTFIPAQAPSQYRITLQLRLNRPKLGRRTYKVGESELQFDSGPTAVWTFHLRTPKDLNQIP
jgi:hypothetical protein